MMRGKTARDLSEVEVRDLAVGYLTRREYGIEELKRKLLQRGIETGVAEQVIGELIDENLVSDQRFAEMYVRTRIRRLFGPLKIRGYTQRVLSFNHNATFCFRTGDNFSYTLAW